VIVGLIAHLTGDALQEDIARTLRTLHSRGQAVMGITSPGLTMKKHLLDPHRVRRVPSQFSWLDHRLVRQNHLTRASACAWGLYLVLVTVGDDTG